jgi:hypothetical protein
MDAGAKGKLDAGTHATHGANPSSEANAGDAGQDDDEDADAGAGASDSDDSDAGEVTQTRPPGSTCGGIAALTCEKAQFCNYEPSAGGQGCDGKVADAGGKCQLRPQICSDVYDAVCGCDRRTYANDCYAHRAGAAAMHKGKCTEIDCAAIGGHAVDGIGPGPMCPAGEKIYTSLGYSNGSTAKEGTACCARP